MHAAPRWTPCRFSLRLTFVQEKLEGVLTLPELPDVAKAIVTYMYTADYEAKSTESLPAFQFHAEMYAAALKYEMPDLCLAACNKLRLHATAGLFLTWEDDETKSQQDDDFLEAVAIVYGNTVNKDDQMRQQLALLARRKMLNAPSRTVERSWVKTMMQVPELAADVMSSITEALGWFNNHAKSRSALSCSDPKCSGVVIMETRTYTYYVERGATVTCQSCFEHNHAKNWIMQPTPDLSDMI